MINDPVGLKAEYIEGVQNVYADTISRTYSKPNTPLSFYQLQEFPHIKSWTRFHPTQEFLSTVYSALFEGQELGLCLTKTLVHFSYDKIIS